jgi:methionyl-tRNA formyltransferase
MNCEELYNKISEISPKMIEETLFGLVEKTIIPEKQDEAGVSVANKLTKEETLIDFSKSAVEIHNLVRGIYHSPSAYFVHNNKIIKVLQTQVCEGNGRAGEFLEVNKSGIKVACGKDALILKIVKPEGKGEMPARDWYNGLKK